MSTRNTGRNINSNNHGKSPADGYRIPVVSCASQTRGKTDICNYTITKQDQDKGANISPITSLPNLFSITI